MKKNTAGQKIGAQMISATDGSAFTGSVTVAVTGDAGTQATGSVGSGACTHEGGGYHTYAPAQAETNYDLIAFTFSGTGAIPVTVQVYTEHDANVTKFGGNAGTFSNGRPEVNTTHWGGTAVGSATVNANMTQISGDSTAADNLEAAADGTGYNLGGGAVVAASVTGAVGSVTGAVGSVTSAVTVGTNNDKTGYSLSSAAIQAIWDALTSALTTAGSIGKLIVDNLNATISSRASQSSLDALNDLSSGDVQTAVGSALTTYGAATASNVSTAESNIRGADSDTLKTISDAQDTILADTNELQTDWADGGRLDALIDLILADTGTDGVVLSSATQQAIADALLDRANGVENGLTLRQALRLVTSAAAGKLSGAATSEVIIRDVNDTKDRITATVDEDGNRTAVTTDLT